MKTGLKIITAVAVLGFSAGFMVNSINRFNGAREANATETSADWNNPYSGSYTGAYYNGITATSGKSLQDQLTSLLNASDVINVGYDGLFDVYPDSDARPEDGSVFDMYGDIHFPMNSKRCGNYSAVGDCWNREHSIPKSWWGGGQNVKYSDAHHLVPTDGYVNNWRGNLALGEVTTPISTKTYSFKKDSVTNVYIQGTSTTGRDADGQDVFEPADCYKGDFARMYFYFATRYQGGATSGDGSKMFSTSQTNFYLTAESKALFLKWHKADPVSIKEVNRNNGVYQHQKNRNPFIDHPEYVEAIWEGTPVVTDKVTLSTSTLSFTVGDAAANLTATSSNGSTISWSSNNTSVATVSTGSSASGTAISITPVNAGSATITASATISGNLVGATCAVTVTKAVKSLAKSGTLTKTAYYVGDAFDPTGLTITATYNDDSNENVTNKVTWTPATMALNTTEVTGSYGGKSVTVNGFTVSPLPEPVATTYSKVTSASDLVAGAKLVMASYGNTAIAGELNDTYLERISASSAFNSDGSKITSLPSGAVVFTLGGSSGNWTLTSSEGQLYCNAAKKLNYSSTGYGTWTISVSSGSCTITSTHSEYGAIKYNSSSPRFTTYTSGQIIPQLYKQDYMSAEQFAQEIMTSTSTICSGSGDKSSQLASVWQTLQTTKWPLVSSSDRTTLQQATANESSLSIIEQAMARYDQICRKYASCSNFIGRASANGSNRILPILNGNVSALVLFISISTVLVIGTVALVLVLRKKKKN